MSDRHALASGLQNVGFLLVGCSVLLGFGLILGVVMTALGKACAAAFGGDWFIWGLCLLGVAISSLSAACFVAGALVRRSQ